VIKRLEHRRGRVSPPLMVVHGYAAYPMPTQTNAAFTTQVVIFGGQLGRCFFFVLSGFVLGESVRRLLSDSLRLWPARYVLIRIAPTATSILTFHCIGGSSLYRVSVLSIGRYGSSVTASKIPPTWAALSEALATLSICFKGVLSRSAWNTG